MPVARRIRQCAELCLGKRHGRRRWSREKFRAADGQIADGYRIDFIREHLRWPHQGLQEGCQCRGYHLWTFIDNWSWSNAYKNRYGLARLELESGERRIKQSGDWFAQVARHNGF